MGIAELCDLNLVVKCDSDTRDLLEHTKKVIDLIKPYNGLEVSLLSQRINKKLKELDSYC